MMTSYDQVAWAAVIQPMGNRYNMPCPNHTLGTGWTWSKDWSEPVQKLNGGRIGKLEAEPKVFCEAASFAVLKHFKKENILKYKRRFKMNSIYYVIIM